MGTVRIILGTVLVVIAGAIALIRWHKEIDSATTWKYGIYVGLMIILSVFVLTALEQHHLLH